MSEAPSWQHMWGAKVKMPCDMEDDVLEDAIKSVTTRLGNYDTEEWEKKGLGVGFPQTWCLIEAEWGFVLIALLWNDEQVCEEIKAHLDAAWDPHWVVCIGRNFGSFVTHVTRNFVFFYYNEKAVMLYKAGACVAIEMSAVEDVALSQRTTRADLESDDPRRHLTALSNLSRLCCESKAQQHATGAFLREPTSFSPTTRLLSVVLSDVQSTDRTLRCAAARLLCQLAYENLVNQESIMQLSKGFSIGWLHVFSVPAAYRPSTSSTQSSQRGLSAFLQELVGDNYKEIYSRVSSYYVTGCTSFLPLCWQFPHTTGSNGDLTANGNDNDSANNDTVPDPAEHVLGFYLVPRQTQFPEPDDSYSDELLKSLDHHELAKLQAVKSAFEKVALVYNSGSTSGSDSVPTAAFISYCETQRAATTSSPSLSDATTTTTSQPLAWLTQQPPETKSTIAPLSAYFDSSTSLSWSNVFTYTAMRLHSVKLTETFDSSAFATTSALFLRLALATRSQITATTCVWTPVFVASVQRDTALPQPFKRHVQSLQRLPSSSTSGSSSKNAKEEDDWRVLLRTTLDQVTPMSWAVFLAQWRAAAAWEKQISDQHAQSEQQLQLLRRSSSVCSVATIRRSIVEQLKPQSYRDLDELRRELPSIARFASQQDLIRDKHSARSLPRFREELSDSDEEEEEDDDDDDEEEEGGCNGTGVVDTDSLSYNMALFHRMQHSLAELDALSLQKLQERQREKFRVMETVALNKKRAEQDAQLKRLELDEKLKTIETKQQEMEHRKAQARAKAYEREQRKHELAARRKQQQDAELEIKQQELAEKIAQRERERLQRQRQEERQRCIRPQRPLATERTAVPTPPSSKRPQSARGASSVAAKSAATAVVTDPELLRQRALLYGQVVSKIYMAEAATRDMASPSLNEPPTFHQPHHLTRSFSIYGNTSFNVKAPLLKTTQPSSARSRRNLYSRALRREEEEEMARQNEAVASVEKEDEGGGGGGAVTQQQRDNDEDDDQDEDHTRLRTRKARASRSPTRPPNDPLVTALSPSCQRPVAVVGSGNACSTLVMRSAALAVSERIRIPDVPAPAVDEPSVPPYVIAAQYEALDDQYKRNFRQRFNLKCVSHRLSFDVLKQYTKMVRRDMAWRAFHDKSGHSERIKYMEFVDVAQSLGIALSEKKLLGVARQLDPKKSGYVDWKAFYTWWSVQYSESTAAPTR